MRAWFEGMVAGCKLNSTSDNEIIPTSYSCL